MRFTNVTLKTDRGMNTMYFWDNFYETVRSMLLTSGEAETLRRILEADEAQDDIDPIACEFVWKVY